MVDPIADMLTRIRNAQAVSKETVELPFSRIKYGVAKILEQHGFVGKVDFKGRKQKKIIEIRLKYQDRIPVIAELRRVSKPAQRIYKSAEELKQRRSARGVRILSTSRGLMTDREAQKQNVGGEVLLEIF